MDEDDESRKVAAVCEVGGSAYAAVERANGDLHPVGRTDGCCSDSKLCILSDSYSDADTRESW